MIEWKIEYDDLRSIVCLTFGTVVSQEIVQASTMKFIDLLKSKGASKILTDFTFTETFTVTTTDVFNLPSSYRKLGLTSTFQEAIVVPITSPVREAAAFYETVCRNRGITVALFENRATAINWLVKETETGDAIPDAFA